MMNLPLPGNQASRSFTSLETVWGYIRHEFLYLSAALMDVALITPLSLSFMVWARYWPPGQVALWLLLVMLVPFNLGRVMGILGIAREHQRTLMFIGLFLTVLISLRTLLYTPRTLFDMSWLGEFFVHVGQTESQLWARDISVFFLTVLMWWRGTALINREISINRTGLRLRVGGLIIAPLIIWLSYYQLLWSIVPFLFLFFLSGLTAAALIRIEQLERIRSRRATAFTPRWLGSVFGAGFLVIATAGVLTALATGDSAMVMAGWLSPLWDTMLLGGAVVLATLTYISFPLLAVLEVLLQFLVVIFSWIWARIMPGLSQLGQLLDRELNDPFEGITPEATVEITGISTGGRINTILIMVAIMLLVALVLSRLYRQATLAAATGGPAGRIENSKPDKSGLGQRLWQRLGFLRHWRTAASIRHIYQRMCQAAAAIGYPRSSSETPYEYLTTLARAWPDNIADAERITQAYVRVRYGEIPETEAELEEIQAAWRRLEATKPLPNIDQDKVSSTVQEVKKDTIQNH